MSKTVNREMLDKWIEENGPYGHEKLSIQAEVSYPTIGEIRRGHVPSLHIQKRLASIVGPIDELFPPATSGEGEAS